MARKQRDGGEVAALVKSIIAEHLGVDDEEVTDDATLGDDLGADSLDFVELVMALEEEFDIELPEGVSDPAWYGGDPDRQGAEAGSGRVRDVVALVVKRAGVGA